MTSQGTAGNEVLQATYSIFMPSSVLQSDLANLGVLGVYDVAAVPENKQFPYISLGEISETQEDTLTEWGYNVRWTPHIYTRDRGSQRGLNILGCMNRLLRRVQLPLATMHFVGIWYISELHGEEPDGLTQMVTPTYQVKVQEII